MNTIIHHSVRALISEVETRLREGGVASARAEAEWLVAEACGLGRTELYLVGSTPDPHILERIDGWVSRRLTGEPLQYVMGYTDFCGHRLAVSPEVLIPRPETETLVEHAVAHLRQRVLSSAEGRARSLDSPAFGGVTRDVTPDESRDRPERAKRVEGRQQCSPGLAQGVPQAPAPAVLDLGTGSGNIAMSVALAVPSCVVIAVELSWNALLVARENLRRFQLDDRIRLVQADWIRGVARGSDDVGRFDLVISNPPYVPRAELDRLPQELQHEPRLSLDGGEDGMSHHRRLVAEIPDLLRDGGVVCLECAESQAEPLCDLVRHQPWVRQAVVINDLAGRPRGLWVEAI